MLSFFPQVFRKASKMTVSLAFLLCLLRRTSSFPKNGSACPTGSSYYLSSCFTYFNHRLNWAQAEVCVYDFAYNFKSSSSCSGSFSTFITPKIGDGIVLFYFSKMCTIIQIIGITFSTFSFPGFMSTIWLLSSHHPKCSGSLCHSYFDKKNLQHNENIRIRLDKSIQVLLNYFSKRGYIFFLYFLHEEGSNMGLLVNQDTYVFGLLVFVRFPNLNYKLNSTFLKLANS